MERFKSSNGEAGFSLLETVIATSMMATALVVLAQMFALSVQNNISGRNGTFSTVLAQQKIEQLRSLMWGFDNIGLPLSDTSTNTALATESPTGGTGLSPSPAGALISNTNGYVDYLDEFGRVIGGGSTVPSNAVYIRRWSIEPLPTNPNDTLIIQVLVTTNRNRGAADSSGSTARLRDEARAMTVKTRKAQ